MGVGVNACVVGKQMIGGVMMGVEVVIRGGGGLVIVALLVPGVVGSKNACVVGK